MRSYASWLVMAAKSLIPSSEIAVAAPPDVTASVQAATSPPMTFDARVTPLPHGYQGPFVNMPDDSILGIEANTVIRSKDKGATWTASELFSDAQKAKLKLTVSRERALVRTKDGTLVLGCMNLAERYWTWNKQTL